MTTPRPRWPSAGAASTRSCGGPAAIPEGAEWYEKPRLVPTKTFLSDLPETTIWRRQLVLGPAPEVCVAVPGTESRRRIWPAA